MPKPIVVLIVAVAAAVLGAIALSQAASAPIQPTTRTRIRARAYTPVAAALYRRFSVLRAARQAASSTGAGLPAASAEHLTEPGTLVSEYELEPAQVRYIDVEGTHAWVIPGSRGICLGIPSSDGYSISTTCGSLADAGTSGLLMVMRGSAGAVVYGLVPDGDSVAVANQDGSSVGLPIASNFFAYSSPAARSVSVRKADGSTLEVMAVGR